LVLVSDLISPILQFIFRFFLGIMNALDGRNQSSKTAGTGGLLQAASYVSALSGGSWLVTSLAMADFPTIQDLIFKPASDTHAFGGWLANINVLQPSNDTAIVTQYITTLFGEIAGKLKAGFPVGWADVWSRALARHFVNGTTSENLLSNATNHGAGITFSSIANVYVGISQQSLVCACIDELTSFLQGRHLSLTNNRSPSSSRTLTP
jgi:lysophospholipase